MAMVIIFCAWLMRVDSMAVVADKDNYDIVPLLHYQEMFKKTPG